MESTKSNPTEETQIPDLTLISEFLQNNASTYSAPDDAELRRKRARESHLRLQEHLNAENPHTAKNTDTTAHMDNEDEEMFVRQEQEQEEPAKKRSRRTPYLTNAEIRDSVRVGLESSGTLRTPKSGLLGRGSKSIGTGKGKKKSKANDIDIATLGGSNPIADAQENSSLPAIPVSTQGNKANALKELIASLPEEAKTAAVPDKQVVIEATKKFNCKLKIDKQNGEWKHRDLQSTLFHHQVLGAAFMREREHSPTKPQGGMLCDVMGFGKTIQTLANIVDGEKEELEDNANATLIVAPRGVIGQWRSEIKKHVKENVLDPVMPYYAGSKMEPDAAVQFLECSKIIITSYDEVRASYPKLEKPENMTLEEALHWAIKIYKENAGPLHQLRFRRIILDEGQQIRNPSSQTSIAVRALHAHYKWILSGTPLLNHNAEFWAYFNFIGVPNIGGFPNFVRNYCQGTTSSNQRLTDIVKTVVYRRTHRSRLFSCPIITLPRIGEQVVAIKPLAIEEALYKMITLHFIEGINRLASSDVHDAQNRSFLTMLLKLRMLNSHPLCVQSILKFLLSDEDAGNMTKLENAVMEEKGDDAEANQKILSLIQGLVLAGKAAKTHNTLVSLEDDDNESSGEGIDWVASAGSEMPSSKTNKTRSIIQKWFEEAPDSKVVIFTQFRAMATILSQICKKEEWSYVMLTGDSDFRARQQSIDQFQTNPEVKIMVASLKAGGVGLDLTSGNKCILLEPWWNDAIQQQAFCRLFRIGQKREVEIVKLYMENTIDNFMMQLQKSKLKEIEGSIGDVSLPVAVDQNELMHLFGDIERTETGGVYCSPERLG